jgi:glycosyltransferase involved in cell wall biosynthesis
MKKIAYITARTPLGLGEAFIVSEMLELKRLGANMLIIPRDISADSFHKKAEPLYKDTLIIPLIDFKILRESLKYIYNNPIFFMKIINNIAFKARNAKIALKNLIILPKALYLTFILKRESISHIHAHWGSTTSTIAFIINKITNIPWSFTVHRWDILENNILKKKCETASFVRCIDENGHKRMVEIIKERFLINKLLIIHMGVDIPEINQEKDSSSGVFTLLCPANFEPVKGHKYLIEACRILSDKDTKFKCLIAGDGPLENELKGLVEEFSLKGSIEFLGRLPHEKLFNLYTTGKVNAVVLPSIVTEDGENEGIPVALMEAMSYGIPVISTNTGGIPELIGDGFGIILKEKDPKAIANAIEKLMNDESLYNKLVEKGKHKVRMSFNINAIARELLRLFSVNRQLNS